MNVFNKKLHYGVVLSVILVILSIFFVVTTYANNTRPATPEIVKVTFQGEYHYEDEYQWKKIEKSTKFDALKGDLILRGNFYYLDSKGNVLEDKEYESINLAMYFDHIEATISQNGVKVWSHLRDNFSDDYYGCGKTWLYYIHNNNIEGHTVITLHNPHSFGNNNAYNDFLNSIYENSGDTLHEYLHAKGEFEKNTGIVLLIMSLFVIGVALFATLMHLENTSIVWLIGAITAALGGFFFFGSPNIGLWNNFAALNTAALIVIKYLLFFFVMLLITTLMSPRAKKIATPAVVLSMAVNVICIILAMYNIIFIYDADKYWAMFNFVSMSTLLVIGLIDLKRKNENKSMFLISIFITVAMIVDIILLRNGNDNYRFSKSTILLVLIILFFTMIKDLPVNFRAALKAKELEASLQNYRVSISLSQIQHHFLYNSLTAIHYLCDKDPKKAKQAIGWFSSYLRSNLDKIKEEKPISFTEALKHIEIYLKLEKLRFEDELNVIYDIEVSNFQIPSLVVQPLVENAVNHGVGDKEGGGSVIIRTRELEDHYEIIIEDDGVGFDDSKPKEDGRSHVGLSNVRERLELICKGKLIIKSEIGKGTIATIVIPKEEN